MNDLSSHLPFVVTGASGYAASWVLAELLSRGASVRATVRDPANEAKCRHLLDMGEALPGTLELVKADLLDQGSFAGAVDGAKNVLDAVNKAASVGKVVLTSSGETA